MKYEDTSKTQLTAVLRNEDKAAVLIDLSHLGKQCLDKDVL